MASLTQWTWVWADSGTGKPGVLQSMGLQRAGHSWVTEQQHSQWPKFINRKKRQRKADPETLGGEETEVVPQKGAAEETKDQHHWFHTVCYLSTYLRMENFALYLEYLFHFNPLWYINLFHLKFLFVKLLLGFRVIQTQMAPSPQFSIYNTLLTSISFLRG